MALKKPEPQFESPDGGVLDGQATRVANAPEVAAATPTDAQHASAGVETTLAIAKAGTTAVGAVGGKFKMGLTDTLNSIAIEHVEAMGMGGAPRVIATSGNLFQDTKNLGTEISLSILSWNYRWIASPGDDADDAKADVRFSYNGKTIAGTNESILEYVEALRVTEGYDKAKLKQYIDLWGCLTHANGEELAEEDQYPVKLQLAPQSVEAWSALQFAVAVRQSHGKPIGARLVVTAAPKSWKGKNYTAMTFVLK